MYFAVALHAGGAYSFSINPPNAVYVDEPYLSIRRDSVHRHVLSEWRAFANSSELRTCLLKGIQAIRDNQAAWRRRGNGSPRLRRATDGHIGREAAIVRGPPSTSAALESRS